MKRVCANHFLFSRGEVHVNKNRKLVLFVGDEVVIGFLAYKITDTYFHYSDTDVYLFDADAPVQLSDKEILDTFAHCPDHQKGHPS